MPTRRRVARRRRELTPLEYFELQIGPTPGQPPQFRDDDERREAYIEHRARFMREHHPGHRAWAWWRFEASLSDAPDAQELWLAHAGQLERWEEDRLLQSALLPNYGGEALQRTAEAIRARRRDEQLTVGPLSDYDDPEVISEMQAGHEGGGDD